MSMKRSILVVEDDLQVRAMIGAMLDIAGFEVIEVEDGRAALSLLRDQSIDLLITDLRLPEMDGGTLVSRARADERLTGLPVLVLSGYTDTATQPVPADRVIVKPFEMTELVDAVNEMLSASAEEPAAQ
jgi:DNA-binding response OmpR family regulator